MTLKVQVRPQLVFPLENGKKKSRLGDAMRKCKKVFKERR